MASLPPPQAVQIEFCQPSDPSLSQYPAEILGSPWFAQDSFFFQSFDESGRRTTTSAAMTSTIGFRVFSCLDDGMGHASVERILDTWQEEGIENSQEILKVWQSQEGGVSLSFKTNF